MSACDPENLLICEGCERGCHSYCLTPPLESVPEVSLLPLSFYFFFLNLSPLSHHFLPLFLSSLKNREGGYVLVVVSVQNVPPPTLRTSSPVTAATKQFMHLVLPPLFSLSPPPSPLLGTLSLCLLLLLLVLQMGRERGRGKRVGREKGRGKSHQLCGFVKNVCGVGSVGREEGRGGSVGRGREERGQREGREERRRSGNGRQWGG